MWFRGDTFKDINCFHLKGCEEIYYAKGIQKKRAIVSILIQDKITLEEKKNMFLKTKK